MQSLAGKMRVFIERIEQHIFLCILVKLIVVKVEVTVSYVEVHHIYKAGVGMTQWLERKTFIAGPQNCRNEYL